MVLTDFHNGHESYRDRRIREGSLLFYASDFGNFAVCCVIGIPNHEKFRFLTSRTNGEFCGIIELLASGVFASYYGVRVY